MGTVEISVSTQNNWWVETERQVHRTYSRLERLLYHIFSVYFHVFCYSTGKIHVNIYFNCRGLMQLKSRDGG